MADEKELGQAAYELYRATLPGSEFWNEIGAHRKCSWAVVEASIRAVERERCAEAVAAGIAYGFPPEDLPAVIRACIPMRDGEQASPSTLTPAE